jgi:hypothetical protein
VSVNQNSFPSNHSHDFLPSVVMSTIHYLFLCFLPYLGIELLPWSCLQSTCYFMPARSILENMSTRNISQRYILFINSNPSLGVGERWGGIHSHFILQKGFILWVQQLTQITQPYRFRLVWLSCSVLYMILEAEPVIMWRKDERKCFY